MNDLFITRGKHEGDVVKVWRGCPQRIQTGNDVQFYSNEESTCLFNVVDRKAFQDVFGIPVPPVDSRFPLDWKPKR